MRSPKTLLIRALPLAHSYGLIVTVVGMHSPEVGFTVLQRWFDAAEWVRLVEEFRLQVYLCSIIRCFPGRTQDGRGDRRPPRQAILNCAPWLDAELEMLRPAVVIAVGQLAIERFLGPGPLEDRVGRSFGSSPVVVPLPHPSGQSRWLNAPSNRVLLEQALALLSKLRSA